VNILYIITGIAIAAVLLIVVVEILIPIAIIALGNVDSWWSPVRVLPPPGEMYILVRGGPKGPFDKVIESVVGFIYDKDTHLFVNKDELEEGLTEEAKAIDVYLANIGIARVGFWRYYLWRKVSYDKWEKLPGDEAKWGLTSRLRGVKNDRGDTPSIFFRYNMATKIQAAETKGNLPVDAIIVFTLQITNPVQAFFFAGGWEAQTVAAVQEVFRKYVSDKTIDELREEQKGAAEKQEKDKDNFTLVDFIKDLGEGEEENSLLTLFGIQITDARFVQFDLVTDDPEMLKAVRAEQIADLNAKARKKDGEGKRQEREQEALGIRATVEAYGSDPAGTTVAMMEAVQIAKPNVLGGNYLVSVDSERQK